MGPPPGGFFGGPQDKARDALREPKPQSVQEVPGYIRRLTGKFLHRLVYIFRIVWDTRPWILFFMVFMALFNGVTPVIGAWISAELLNSLAAAYVAAANGVNQFSAVMGLLILRFTYSFVVSMVNRVNSIVTNIAGELVVNNVNLRIMNKAREVDLASFDRPEFYEKLENAKREAGHRPIQILNANFTIISTVICQHSYIFMILCHCSR